MPPDPAAAPARPGWLRRRARVIGLLAVLAVAAAPGVDNVPGGPAGVPPLHPHDAVRVPRDGVVLVYDKRERYLLAKAAENFPSVVCPLILADFAERGDDVLAVRPRLRFPWWR